MVLVEVGSEAEDGADLSKVKMQPHPWYRRNLVVSYKMKDIHEGLKPI